MFKRVKKFNEEVIGIKEREIGELNKEEHIWLAGALREEVNELDEAYTNSDFVGTIDSLIDGIYFALGGLYRLGLNEELVEKIFEAVHLANMEKVKGRKKRVIENILDAIKPNNWLSPEEKIMAILEEYENGRTNTKKS